MDDATPLKTLLAEALREVAAASHSPPRIMRLPDIEALTGLKKSQLLQAVDEGQFPRPIKILPNGRSVGWLEREITAFINGRVAERDQAIKTKRGRPRKGTPAD